MRVSQSAKILVFSIALFASCGKKKEDDVVVESSFLSFNLTPHADSLLSFSREVNSSDSVTQKIFRAAWNASNQDGISALFKRFEEEISEINSQIAVSKGSSENPGCWNQEPASRSILTPDDAAFSLKIQCYSSSSNGFALFGGARGSDTYIYIRKSDFIAVVSETKTDDSVRKLEGYISQSYDIGSSKPSAVLRFTILPNDKSFMISLANQNNICGLNLGLKGDTLHGSGSLVESQDTCSSVKSFAFLASDLSQSGTFDASVLYSGVIGRKAGTSATGKLVTEYVNVTGQGNISLGAQANPNINARDLNFGPYTSSELGGREMGTSD